MKLRSLFYMHRSDRQIIIAFLLVAAIVIGAVYLLGGRQEPLPSTVVGQGDSLRSASSTSKKQFYYAQSKHEPERFAFDPNTADSTQLLRLGLQPWQVRNIYKYRAAGGIYRKKEDFARLYGLTVKQYRELEPYIVISADYLPASTLFPEESVKNQSDTAVEQSSQQQRYQHKLAVGEHIDLNVADTAIYQQVPGIGSYYARQIADYGRRLGGYVSVDQLEEINDFPTEAKAYFSIDSSVIQKINVNLLSLNQLKRHPYINYYQARAIVDYRRLHGPLKSLDELCLLPDFPEEAIARLRPYVTF